MSNNNDWDIGDEKPKQSFKSRLDYDIFMKLKPQDEPYKIRLASSPKNFRSHWMAFKALNMKGPVRSPAYSYDEKELDIAWSEGDWMPQRRHACLVFHRDDSNKLKILEAGDSLFTLFGNWYKATNVSPAGNEGTDWFVWVKKEGNNTSYSATPDLKSSPFTEEEKKTLENSPLDLNKIMKIKTPEEIKELWMRLPDDKKYNPKSKFKSGEVFDKQKFESKQADLKQPEHDEYVAENTGENAPSSPPQEDLPF